MKDCTWINKYEIKSWNWITTTIFYFNYFTKYINSFDLIIQVIKKYKFENFYVCIKQNILRNTIDEIKIIILY